MMFKFCNIISIPFIAVPYPLYLDPWIAEVWFVLMADTPTAKITNLMPTRYELHYSKWGDTVIADLMRQTKNTNLSKLIYCTVPPFLHCNDNNTISA